VVSIDEFGENGVFQSGLERIVQMMMSEFREAMKSGNLNRKWMIKKNDSDGVKGFLLQGRFKLSQPWKPFDPSYPFEPMNPLKPLPRPERPFGRSSKTGLQDINEPLADVFEDEKTIKIYCEVRIEDKNDIQLNVTASKVEVKAKNFYKMIDLPTCNIKLEKASSKYRNGVLEVEIPKIEKTLEKELHTISID
jgi:HSP20 family molecular chaperone IbpA